MRSSSFFQKEKPGVLLYWNAENIWGKINIFPLALCECSRKRSSVLSAGATDEGKRSKVCTINRKWWGNTQSLTTHFTIFTSDYLLFIHSIHFHSLLPPFQSLVQMQCNNLYGRVCVEEIDSHQPSTSLASKGYGHFDVNRYASNQFDFWPCPGQCLLIF